MSGSTQRLPVHNGFCARHTLRHSFGAKRDAVVFSEKDSESEIRIA